jgi:hypothetical protein
MRGSRRWQWAALLGVECKLEPAQDRGPGGCGVALCRPEIRRDLYEFSVTSADLLTGAPTSGVYSEALP